MKTESRLLHARPVPAEGDVRVRGRGNRRRRQRLRGQEQQLRRVGERREQGLLPDEPVREGQLLRVVQGGKTRAHDQTHDHQGADDDVHRQAPGLRVVGAEGGVRQEPGVHEAQLLQVVQGWG